MPINTAHAATAFVRRTSLGVNEYHTNFRKIDCETVSRLTSAEATRVTSQLCKIYLSLINAPAGCWEREGVLRFAGEEREGVWVTAWEQLVSLVGVASATARKALRWMHEQGIVGYFAGKNGVGIRVFLNRAVSSIGRRTEAGQKNLRLVRASTGALGTSTADVPFRDSFADLEGLEKDLNPHAPKSGADAPRFGKAVSNHAYQTTVSPSHDSQTAPMPTAPTPPNSFLRIPVEEIVQRLRVGLEPALREAARQAAAREHEQTREWLEARGLPKAARVAQREAYDVLRKHGLVGEGRNVGAKSEVGHKGHTPQEPRPLLDAEINELAQGCVAMFEVQGRSFERTLLEMNIESGGFLLPTDVTKVRARAEELRRAGCSVREE